MSGRRKRKGGKGVYEENWSFPVHQGVEDLMTLSQAQHTRIVVTSIQPSCVQGRSLHRCVVTLR